MNGESKGGDGRGNAARECEGRDGQFMQGLRIAHKRDGRAAMGVKSSAWEGLACLAFRRLRLDSPSAGNVAQSPGPPSYFSLLLPSPACAWQCN